MRIRQTPPTAAPTTIGNKDEGAVLPAALKAVEEKVAPGYPSAEKVSEREERKGGEDTARLSDAKVEGVLALRVQDTAMLTKVF